LTLLEQARKEVRALLERVIDSDRCHCGQVKDRHSTPFCTKCYDSLPRDMRKHWKWLYRNYRYWSGSVKRTVFWNGAGRSAEQLVLESITAGHVTEYDRCLDILGARRRGEIHRKRPEMEEVELGASL